MTFYFIKNIEYMLLYITPRSNKQKMSFNAQENDKSHVEKLVNYPNSSNSSDDVYGGSERPFHNSVPSPNLLGRLIGERSPVTDKPGLLPSMDADSDMTPRNLFRIIKQ